MKKRVGDIEIDDTKYTHIICGCGGEIKLHPTLSLDEFFNATGTFEKLHQDCAASLQKPHVHEYDILSPGYPRHDPTSWQCKCGEANDK